MSAAATGSSSPCCRPGGPGSGSTPPPLNSVACRPGGSRGRVALADARRLPIADESVPAVTALWMLYHLETPDAAIAEAYRVLGDGGLFFACTSARNNDPELTDGYPATTFDAEEAPDRVRAVFGNLIEVLVWDAPLVRLEDRASVARYLRSHHLPPSRVDQVETPLTLTTRGCLVVARKSRR